MKAAIANEDIRFGSQVSRGAVFASALTALTQAIAMLAERSPGGPVTKVVERDEKENIVRILESPQ